MNILHLDHGREMRGGQLQVIRLMKGLRDQGHGVILLARKESPLLKSALTERLNAEPMSLEALRGMSRNAHVVHAHDARSHLFAALLSRKPLVVSRRVAFPVGRGLWSHWKYSQVDRFAAVSHVAEKELRKAGVPASRIRVVYDGVPPLPESWDAKGPAVVLQSNDKRKGSDMAAEAVRRAGGPLLLSQNLPQDLRGAGMLVYITQSEGLGSAALLAMSAGVPVVASDVGGLREFMLNGETGTLVPNQVDAIAAAVRRLRESPEETAKMAARARELVIAKFTVPRMVAETLKVYEGIINAH